MKNATPDNHCTPMRREPRCSHCGGMYFLGLQHVCAPEDVFKQMIQSDEFKQVIKKIINE